MPNQPNHYVFAATTPNIGTTTVAIQHALTLAKQRNRNVIFVCLNLKSSHVHTYFGQKPDVTLDQLLPDVQAKCLSDTRLSEALIRPIRSLPNFRLLCGNMQRECAELFHADDVAYLLDALARLTDELVIDVHAYLDNAATLHVLTQPWHRYCVTSADFHRFAHDYQVGIERLRTMYDLPIAFDRIYVRGNQASSHGVSGRQIREVMGVSTILSISEIEGLSAALIQGQYVEVLMRMKEAA